MTTKCGGINEGAYIDCDFLPRGGTLGDLMLIKKDEWDLAVKNGTITFDATTKNLITSIVLTTGDQGYVFEHFEDMVRPVITMLRRPTGARYKQTVDYSVLGKTAEDEKIIKDMGDERYVAIYQNKFGGNDGDQQYKVLGVETGLRRPEGGAELDLYNEQDGTWILKIESDDEALETTPQYTFYNTDGATTDAQFVTLQSPA